MVPEGCSATGLFVLRLLGNFRGEAVLLLFKDCVNADSVSSGFVVVGVAFGAVSELKKALGKV